MTRAARRTQAWRRPRALRGLLFSLCFGILPGFSIVIYSTLDAYEQVSWRAKRAVQAASFGTSAECTAERTRRSIEGAIPLSTNARAREAKGLVRCGGEQSCSIVTARMLSSNSPMLAATKSAADPWIHPIDSRPSPNAWPQENTLSSLARRAGMCATYELAASAAISAQDAALLSLLMSSCPPPSAVDSCFPSRLAALPSPCPPLRIHRDTTAIQTTRKIPLRHRP